MSATETNNLDATYLTTEELSSRIKYDVRTIRERLMDSVLIEGTHYFRPFGGRKILFDWNVIQRDMRNMMPMRAKQSVGIPMAHGGMLRA